MKMSCGCGLAVGVVAGALICGAVAAYFYFRENPEEADEQMKHVEERWEKIKSGGDSSIRQIKEHIPQKQ